MGDLNLSLIQAAIVIIVVLREVKVRERIEKRIGRDILLGRNKNVEEDTQLIEG